VTGRPRKDADYTPRKRVTYRLAPELVRAIKSGARRKKMSQTAYVELALQQWIKSDGIQIP
jgi:predicted HicB family RNase H-like nuclease